MKRSIRTYYDFAGYSEVVGSDLLSPSAWDSLRGSDANFFSLAASREDWLRSFADRPELLERARFIVSLCHQNGLKRIFSVGVGVGALEFFIKAEDPQLRLTCTDFAPKATARLRDVFDECDEVFPFNMMRDPWRSTPETLYLLHRVDTELSNRGWRACFSRMASSAISPVLVVATELLTPERRKRMRQTYLSHRLHRRPITFSGYVRNREAFRALWARSYETVDEMRVGDLEGFLLALKR